MLVRWGLPFLAVLGISFATWSVLHTKPVEGSEPPPVTPPSAKFGKQVGAVGLIEPASENVEISVPVPGLVMEVMARAGSLVKRGQPLFRLDDRDLQAELALRQSALDLARTRLDRLAAAPRPEDLPPARSKVQEAEAQLSDAQIQLSLMESITDKRAIRAEDLERRRRAVEAARARVSEAQGALKRIEAGTWAPDLEVARREVIQAEKQVQRIQADLQRLTVTSPMDGQVLQVKVRAGEYAQAGKLSEPLMVLGDLSALHVRADVDEKDAWRVKEGAKAVSSVRGNPSQKYDLAFVRFEPYVVPKRNLTNEATERVDTRVLQVIYRLPPDTRLFNGQQMDIFIEASN
ncbi:MAG: efflux RND transporter periplasmic adaptor subunit [Bryobacterales bacterium]|nr:efflux RND transporter periplasmic adaptor subunit [Bryobacterales bacterium]